MQAQAIDLGKLQPSSIKVKINLQYEHMTVYSSIKTAEIKLLYSVHCTVYSIQCTVWSAVCISTAEINDHLSKNCKMWPSSVDDPDLLQNRIQIQLKNPLF